MDIEESEYDAGKSNKMLITGIAGRANGKHSNPQEPGDVKKYKHESLKIEDISIIPPPITPPFNQYGQFFQFMLS